MPNQESVASQLDPSLVGARVAVEELPVIDFGRFLHGSAEERKATVAKFKAAGITP